MVEGDAEKDLINYPDNSFDFAILNQSLQQFYNPRKVLNDLLRIANKAIITIPNFGYWKVRLNLLLEGKMPITKTLPYNWFDTPNLHMSTIKDFYFLLNNPEVDNYLLINKKLKEIKNMNKLERIISGFCKSIALINNLHIQQASLFNIF